MLEHQFRAHLHLEPLRLDPQSSFHQHPTAGVVGRDARGAAGKTKDVEFGLTQFYYLSATISRSVCLLSCLTWPGAWDGSSLTIPTLHCILRLVMFAIVLIWFMFTSFHSFRVMSRRVVAFCLFRIVYAYESACIYFWSFFCMYVCTVQDNIPYFWNEYAPLSISIYYLLDSENK